MYQCTLFFLTLVTSLFLLELHLLFCSDPSERPVLHRHVDTWAGLGPCLLFYTAGSGFPRSMTFRFPVDPTRCFLFRQRVHLLALGQLGAGPLGGHTGQVASPIQVNLVWTLQSGSVRTSVVSGYVTLCHVTSPCLVVSCCVMP